MKTHRAHAHTGLEFLFVEASSPTLSGEASRTGKPTDLSQSFENQFKIQSEQLLASLAQAKTGQSESSSPRLAPTEVPSPLVPISERVAIWLGPAGPAAMEIPQEGLRRFGREQGLTESALDALLGRTSPLAEGQPQIMSTQGLSAALISSEVAKGAIADPAGFARTTTAAVPQRETTTAFNPPALVTLQAGQELQPEAEPGPAPLPVRLQVQGWTASVQGWLAQRWAVRLEPVVGPRDPGVPLRIDPQAGRVRIDWAEVGAQSGGAKAQPDPAAKLTEDFLAAKALLSSEADRGVDLDRGTAHESRPFAEGPRLHAPSPANLNSDAMQSAQDAGDQADFSQQSASGGSGQPGSGGGAGAPLTGQQLSERFGELLGRRMIQQIESGNWKLDVELHPDDLGSIQVEMTWQDGQLEAVFTADQLATRELLDQGLSKLRDSLLNNGTSLAYLSVNDEKRRQDQGRFDRRQDRRPELAEDVEVNEVEQGAKPKAQSSSLDILV